MARHKRICKTCHQQIKRGEHWRMVPSSTWARIFGISPQKPQHRNCDHPTQPSPHMFVGVEKRLPETPQQEVDRLSGELSELHAKMTNV